MNGANHTLTAPIDRYIEHRRATGEFTEQTAKNTRLLLYGLARAHGNRPLNQYGPATINRWREQIGHLEDSTRALYQSHVRTFSRWLANSTAHPEVTKDATFAMPRVPLHRHHPVTLTSDECDQLYTHLAGQPRANAIAHLLLDCGLRCVEVSRLRMTDYDPRAQVLVVRGKGGHERALPVPRATQRALAAYFDEAGRRTGPMIRSEVHPNRPLAPKSISIYVRRWMAEAGVKVAAWDGRSAHALRRTAGSEVMERTGNVQVVQEMLGHASIEVTARHYLRRVPIEQLREAMDRRDEAA